MTQGCLWTPPSVIHKILFILCTGGSINGIVYVPGDGVCLSSSDELDDRLTCRSCSVDDADDILYTSGSESVDLDMMAVAIPVTKSFSVFSLPSADDEDCACSGGSVNINFSAYM